MAYQRRTRRSATPYLTARVAALSTRALEWGRGRRRQVVVALSVAVGLLIVIGAAAIYRSRTHAHGAEALRQGMVALRDGQVEAAVAQLRVAERLLGDGTARQLAWLHLGEAYLEQENTADAQEAFRATLAAETDQPGFLSQLAELQLGRLAEESGDLAAAATWYTRAADVTGPMRPEALISAARVLEANDELDDAHAMYKEFVDAYPDSPLADIARLKSAG